MSKRLFWKFCLIIATGVVALFWLIDVATSVTETDMSMLDAQHRQQITAWGTQAERLYLDGDLEALEAWLDTLGRRENTFVAVARTNPVSVAGQALPASYYQGYSMGRSVDWQIHLYFEDNPVMEVPFSNGLTSFLIQLPDRMRPGKNLELTWLSLQIVLPLFLLVLVSIMLYRHIMNPLRKLQLVTKQFSRGNFDVRARDMLGDRSDEFSELADTFDQMATRIGEQIINQRQLIADISHELRTPLTRLDISVQNLQEGQDMDANLERIRRESGNIRNLVDDSLTLAWLENERPELQSESLDLTDLLDVLVDDARFEFPDRHLDVALPATARIHHSNHQALGQALENILRNALRYTPPNKSVSVHMHDHADHFCISIKDQGEGVPEEDLSRIFLPFFRLPSGPDEGTTGFGLGLALAKRQITAVGGVLRAYINSDGGLGMDIDLPKAT